MSAFKLGFSSDVVLDEINQMKKEREADQQRLDSLVQTRDNITKMIDMESNLKELALELCRTWIIAPIATKKMLIPILI